MTDNKKIAEQVLAAVGGAANLKDATHCMTRLRLYLKDDSLPKDDEVKKISGVLGVVRGGQQYQIVIGTNVPKVYEELCKLAGISASAAVKDDAAAAQDAAITKRKLTPKQVGKKLSGRLYDPHDPGAAGRRLVPCCQLYLWPRPAGPVLYGKQPVHPV